MPDPESSPRFRALINYRTPAGGQGSRKRRIASAWSAVQSFLRDCAEVEPIDHATLALFDADEYTPDYDPRPLLEATVELLGPARAAVWARPGFGTEVERELGASRVFRWTVPPSGIDAVVEYLESGEPWPRHYLGPLKLNVRWRFTLRDPRTRSVLPFQDRSHYVDAYWARSQLGLSLGPRSVVDLDLNFPWEEPDSEFLEYVEALAPRVPVRLTASRFRLLRPNARASAYVARRLQPGMFDGALA